MLSPIQLPINLFSSVFLQNKVGLFSNTDISMPNYKISIKGPSRAKPKKGPFFTYEGIYGKMRFWRPYTMKIDDLLMFDDRK